MPRFAPIFRGKLSCLYYSMTEPIWKVEAKYGKSGQAIVCCFSYTSSKLCIARLHFHRLLRFAAFSVFRRRDPVLHTKSAGKITAVVKTALHGDCRDAFPACGEQDACLLQPVKYEIVYGCAVCHIPEDLAEIAGV